MGEWQTISLKDAVKSGRGISYGIVQPGAHVSDGVPIIRVSDIRNGRLSTDAPLRVRADIEQQYSRTRLTGGELLITIVGTVGEMVIAPKEVAGWNVARAVAVLPIRDDIGAYWVQLALNAPSVRALIDSRLNTTVQPTLNLGDLSLLPILLPPAEQRQSIAATLGALESKIDLNHRMNKTLEAMARAIFKDWFIDFGPTRAKMAGRAPYLASEIWALFPDRLDNEGKPEGWANVELGSVVSELRRGISPTYIQDGGVRVLNQKCVRNRRVDTNASRRHDRNKRAVEGREVNIGDILINSTGVGTLGRTAQIWEIDEPTVVDSHVTVVRAHTDRVSSCYLGLNLTGREHEIEALGEGSTGQTELSRTRVAALLLLLPPMRSQKEFEKCGQPLVNRMTTNWRENRTIAATRDLLLPKLMSGKIRVKDAEKLAEAVL